MTAETKHQPSHKHCDYLRDRVDFLDPLFSLAFDLLFLRFFGAVSSSPMSVKGLSLPSMSDSTIGLSLRLPFVQWKS